MGQYEVFKWLKMQAECGQTQYFTPQEVEKGLKAQGLSNGALQGIRRDLIKLSISKIILTQDLDKTGLNNYKRVFKYEITTRKKEV